MGGAGVYALLLLLLTTAHAIPCTPEDVWALCQRDTRCAFLYRLEKLTGIKRALEFYTYREWQIPGWPPSWRAPSSNPMVECDYPANGTSASGFLSSTAPLPPGLQFVLYAVERYRDYAEGTTGCPSPKIMQCDDETNQCECFCPGGDMTCASTDSCSNSVINWAIALSVTWLVLALIAIIVATVTTWRTINLVLSKRHEGETR